VTTIEKCPGCSSVEMYRDTKTGETSCKVCGTVIEDRVIDRGPQYALDEDGISRMHVGQPISSAQVNFGLTTTIGTNKELMKSKSGYRLRRASVQSLPYVEKSISIGLIEIKRVCATLKIIKIVEEDIARTYRDMVYKDMMRGRSMESIIAGLVYITCSIYEYPRLLSEVAFATHIKKGEINRAVQIIQRTKILRPKIVKANDLLSKISSELGMNAMSERIASEIISDAEKLGITEGKSPAVIASAALYIAGLVTGQKRTQREMALVTDITEVTVRSRVKELMQRLEIEENYERYK
jgi:transcription initiation factor TFIIB